MAIHFPYWKVVEMNMTPEEARKALGGVGETERRLAERMHWPFSRHAMFGLAEALIVLAVGTPGGTGAAAAGAGIALALSLMYQDKQRYGMFVSGWHGDRTKPLMIVLIAALLAFVAAAVLLRPAEGVEPLVVLVGGLTWIVCTALSMRWEKLYRLELREGADR